MGKKTTLNFLRGRVHNISIDSNQVPESMDLVDPENKNSKSDLDVPLAVDPLEICPILTQKMKKIQDRPAGVPSGPWPPAQTH